MYGKVAGRVVKRPNKTGYSFAFSVVKNKRNWHTGQSEHLLVAHIGTIKDSEIDKKAKSFWNKVDTTLKILIDSGEIDNCRSEICAKFERYIPRPTVAVAAPVPAATSAINQTVADRVKERFGNLV